MKQVDKERMLYIYNGSVLHYKQEIARNWQAETTASSEKQARSNLAYQFRKKNGYVPTYHIELPSKLTVLA